MQIQTSRTKRSVGPVYTQRRLWSYGHRRCLKNACPWGLDYYPFETVMLHALSELNPDDFKTSFTADDERTKLSQSINGIEIKIKDLEKSVLDLSSNGSALRIAKLIDELQAKKLEAEQRYEALVGIHDASRPEIVEGLKSIATLCGSNSKSENQNLRHKIKSIIPTLVERVDLVLLKRQNRTVMAKGVIRFINGQERIISVRKTPGWRDIKRVVFFDANKRPTILLCAVGSVIWSDVHGLSENQINKMSQKELGQMKIIRHDVKWVAVDGEMREMSPPYDRLLNDYLNDEIEDFSQASMDWSE
jgi:hypothetical protein